MKGKPYELQSKPLRIHQLKFDKITRNLIFRKFLMWMTSLIHETCFCGVVTMTETEYMCRKVEDPNWEFRCLGCCARYLADSIVDDRVYSVHILNMADQAIRQLRACDLCGPDRKFGCIRCTSLLLKEIDIPVIIGEEYEWGSL